MRFIGRALAASAFVLGACAGGDNANPGTGETAAAGTAPASGQTGSQTGAQAAITGTTHRVRMVLDGTAYKFIPDKITIKTGDGIAYINESGGPHNVDFSIGNLPAAVQSQLAASMPEMAGATPKLGPLSGPLITELNAVYTISFANIPTGSYPFTCTPHAAMGMNGNVTVQ